MFLVALPELKVQLPPQAGGVVGPEGETGDGTQHASASEAARFVHQIMAGVEQIHRSLGR